MVLPAPVGEGCTTGGKASQRVRLSRDGDVLTGSIGEWAVAGTDVVQVVVQDEYGKDSGKTAVTVQRCARG